MNIQALRSDHIYRQVMQVPLAEKTELYREEMLAPFMKKWETQQVPYKAADPGGFDVMTINNFIFRAPEEMTPEISAELELISSDAFWQECEAVVARSLGLFTENGVKLKVSEYLFTILLGNPKSQSLLLNEGYSGDGGIPGYILCTLLPNAYTLPRMKPALAHEVNHNVRYQYIQWDHTVTLGELIVSEGLAENFATLLYGEELVGPWVSRTDAETLNRQIKPLLKERLDVNGFDQIAPYLYGDELAKLQNHTPVGAPYCAGYACGYYLVQYYLEKTGKSIVEATITPADQILDEVRGYWNETTIVSG